MEPLQGKLLDGDPVLFDDIDGRCRSRRARASKGGGTVLATRRSPGRCHRKYTLICDDGRAGEMTMERFKSRDAVGDVAIFQDNPDVA